MDVKIRVINIVKEISQNIYKSDEELFIMDYLDKGLIDSFQIVEMITKLEDSFHITFSPEELESEDFRTLKGVTKLIKEKIQKEINN